MFSRTDLSLSLTLLACVATAAGMSVAARQPAPVSAASAVPAARRPGTDPLTAAEERVRRAPGDVSARQSLAVALMRRQRESGNPALYGRAEAQLREALRQAPDDYSSRKLLAWVLAGQHRFDEALEMARDCSRRNPSDAWNYGVMADAHTETGDYDRALETVQAMVDLRPDAPSYSRAAHQRRLHGDSSGALALYDLALDATAERDGEGRAWILTQKAEIALATGRMEQAEDSVTRALAARPGYHLALAARARTLASRGRLDQAAEAWREALKAVDRPDWRAALGDTFKARGLDAEADAEYRAAEARLERSMEDPAADARHQLAQMLADRGRSPERALRLASEEAADATDIHACDTHAWALYHAGRAAEAWPRARQALRLGTEDPKLLYHAGMIALRLPGREAEGARLLRRALALNPSWDPLDAPAARAALRPAGVSSAAVPRAKKP